MALVSWLIGVLLIGVPLYRLLPRAGVNAGWAVVSIVPIAGIALLWIVAFRHWPGDAPHERF